MDRRHNRKYNKEYCEKVIEWMEQGYSFESFAGSLYITRKTLYNWMESHPEFAEAKQVAEERCRIFWERMGIKGMLLGDKEKFNAAVWVFNMKNRFKWHDRHEIQHELGEGTKQLLLDAAKAKEIIQADPIDVKVIDVTSDDL